MKTCPRCNQPIDDHVTRCTFCSALLDSLYEDEYVDSNRLFIGENGVSILGVVIDDIRDSPWTSQEDFLRMVMDSSNLPDLGMMEAEGTLGRLVSHQAYWLWIYHRGGTAIPFSDEDQVTFEPVALRLATINTVVAAGKALMHSRALLN